jgi:hypothetical protein
MGRPGGTFRGRTEGDETRHGRRVVLLPVLIARIFILILPIVISTIVPRKILPPGGAFRPVFPFAPMDATRVCQTDIIAVGRSAMFAFSPAAVLATPDFVASFVILIAAILFAAFRSLDLAPPFGFRIASRVIAG